MEGSCSLSSMVELGEVLRGLRGSEYYETDGESVLVAWENGGLRVAFRLARQHARGAWEIVETATYAPQGTTPEAVRRIPYGRLIAQARESLALRDRPGESQRVMSPSEASLAAFLTGRRGVKISDQDYALLAFEYAWMVLQGNRKPAQTLSDQYRHGSASQWANRVREARRRGLLTDVERGESGGRLTERAEKLLGLDQA